MIDGQELQEIEQRHTAARKALDAVAVHTDGGLFGDVPPEQAVPLLTAAAASARDIPRLLDVVRTLVPAGYLHGPLPCVEGDCEHEPLPDTWWCANVQPKVATLNDVKRAAYLDTLVQAMKEAAEREQRGEPADNSGALRPLAELVVTAVDNTRHRIKQYETTGEERTW